MGKSSIDGDTMRMSCQYDGAQLTNRDSQTSSFSVCSADPKCYPYWFVLRTGFPDYDHPNKVGLKVTLF